MNDVRVKPDRYGIGKYVEDIKALYIPANESNTLMTGIFGYMNDIFSNNIQDNIEMASQWSNEIFPIRAQLERSLITHAMMAGIHNINALPGFMEMMIGIKEKDLLRYMVNDTYKITKDTVIHIDEFDFHIENDVNLFRRKSSDGRNIYLAQYDFDKNNRLTSIKNPYILPPAQINVGGDLFIMVRVMLRQITITPFDKKIISNKTIENKTFDFKFSDQLADLRVFVESGNRNTEYIPIYGEAPIVNDGKYVRYSYISGNSIRVMFINNQDVPSIGDSIHVDIITTKGERATFKYNEHITISPNPDNTVNTKNLLMLGIPATESGGGMNRKSIDDLKKEIPRELLSRGSITNSKDLENFFNTVDDRYGRLRFLKKVDNQFQRTYSSFMLLKDDNENILPTNTVDGVFKLSDFDVIGDRFILKPGTPLEYNKTEDKCKKVPKGVLSTNIIKEKENNGFLYGSPFTTIVNRTPLSVSHYLTIFDNKYSLLFNQIADIPLLQFIGTSANWNRGLVLDENTYKLDISLAQNMDDDFELVEMTDKGIIKSTKIKAIAVFHDADGNPLRYTEGALVSYSEKTKKYNIRFNLDTTNNITRDARIEINNTKEIGSHNISNALYPAVNCKTEIYILAKGISTLNNTSALDVMVPGLDGYTLCNTYSIENGLDFYINFSHVVSSVVKPVFVGGTQNTGYTINEIPVVRYSHLTSTAQTKYLINYIMNKKYFIDRAINVLENNFEVDFKFFNTYGPSKLYLLGNTDDRLDRVNLKISLKVKFTTNTNTESFTKLIKKEIKTHVENLDNIGDFHILDVTTNLKNKFEFISYIEFAKINEYPTEHQSLLQDMTLKEYVIPEFINVGSKDIKYEPDITITVL